MGTAADGAPGGGAPLSAGRLPPCQAAVRAERPAHVPPGAFGPHLTSLVGLLNGRYRLSKRGVADLLASAFGIEMSLGMVVRATEQLTAALAALYAAVQATVVPAALAYVDETRWKQAGMRRWLWVAVSTAGTLFYLAASRAGRELEHLIGSHFGGIVVSDRYRAYLRLPGAQRQLCWAHLKRDLVACSQAPGDTGAWGLRALEVVAQLFALWHRFKQGELDRSTLQQQTQPQQEAFRALLEEGLTLPAWSKANAFCRDVRAVAPALWTFLFVEEVEPTGRPRGEYGRACLATGRSLAQRLLRLTERPGLALRRTHPDRHGDLQTAATTSASLLD